MKMTWKTNLLAFFLLAGVIAIILASNKNSHDEYADTLEEVIKDDTIILSSKDPVITSPLLVFNTDDIDTYDGKDRPKIAIASDVNTGVISTPDGGVIYIAGGIETKKDGLRAAYEEGYKDALDHLALLNLELSLTEERKTFGEMFEILYERHNINKND